METLEDILNNITKQNNIQNTSKHNSITDELKTQMEKVKSGEVSIEEFIDDNDTHSQHDLQIPIKQVETVDDIIVSVTLEELDPNSIVPTEYELEITDDGVNIYRITKENTKKKFDKRGKSYIWFHKILLEKNNIPVDTVQYLQRGQVLLSGTVNSTRYIIIDDFTYQTNGKFILISDDVKSSVFRHTKSDIKNILKALKGL